VEELVKNYSFKPVRRSALKENKRLPEPANFIILDTVGELATVYGLATLVFVGGSFIPKGGQNIIEPAFWGKPILFGPYMDNFKEVVRIFLEKEAAGQVRDGQELTRKLDCFLRHREKAEEMGSRAQALVQANQGAAKKSAELVLEFIN
jgi:3-deoxy-D-manno-octulosonic-acid transferase